MPPKGMNTAPRVEVTCPCGVVFSVRKKLYDQGKGRRCSKKCQYAFMERPSGLTYTKHKENPTQFVAGQQPHNKGDFKDDANYVTIHRWIRRTKVKTGSCQHCGTSEKPTEWANKSREYKRELDDWLELCKLCHRRYDADHRGAATRKFGSI